MAASPLFVSTILITWPDRRRTDLTGVVVVAMAKKGNKIYLKKKISMRKLMEKWFAWVRNRIEAYIVTRTESDLRSGEVAKRRSFFSRKF